MVERLRPVRASTVRIRRIFSGSGMMRPLLHEDDVRMRTFEVNASPRRRLVPQSCSRVVAVYDSGPRRAAGMLVSG